MKLTTEIAAQIVDAIALGADRVQSAASASVPYVEFREWVRMGELGRQPYAGWVRSIERAEAERLMRVLAERLASPGRTGCAHCAQIMTEFGSVLLGQYLRSHDYEALERAVDEWDRIGRAHGLREQSQRTEE